MAVGWASIPNDWRQTHRKSAVKTEVETGVMCLQAKEYPGLLAKTNS